MTDLAAKAELMRSLRRLASGLTAIFWGLPAALIVFSLLWIQGLTMDLRPYPLTEWLQSFNILPPLAVTGLLYFGVAQLGHFQTQERVWQHALERAKFTALVSAGFAPFIYWWNKLPHHPFFTLALSVLVISMLIFLAQLNLVLNRLAAMLPDETLRVETRFFSVMNVWILLALQVSLMALLILRKAGPLLWAGLPRLPQLEWMFLFLVLVPIAMTMTLAWKIKGVILEAVFGPQA